jgi:hypothetical protein
MPCLSSTFSIRFQNKIKPDKIASKVDQMWYDRATFSTFRPILVWERAWCQTFFEKLIFKKRLNRTLNSLLVQCAPPPPPFSHVLIIIQPLFMIFLQISGHILRRRPRYENCC